MKVTFKRTLSNFLIPVFTLAVLPQRLLSNCIQTQLIVQSSEHIQLGKWTPEFGNWMKPQRAKQIQV